MELPWFLSERGHPPELADDVGQPLGQPTPARLFHMKCSGQQVVEGAVAHCHHGAGQANDIIGHAEVWCWQVHQQWLCVEAHKIAGAIEGRKPGERKQERESQPTQDFCFVLPRWDDSSQQLAGAEVQRRFPAQVHSQ